MSQDFDLVEEQVTAKQRLHEFVTNKGEDKQIIHFIAPAGTGKTYSLRALTKDLSLEGKKATAVSFTGRASAHLAKSGLPASTCHSILYTPILDSDGDLVSWDKKDRDEILEACGDVIIVDESSMIPREIHDAFVETGLPIIYTGDDQQLPSVSDDAFCVFDDDSKEKVSLTINHRTDPSLSGIISLSQHLREQNSIPRRKGAGLNIFPKAKAFTRRFYEDNSFDVVICGMNKTRKMLNERIRSAMGLDSSEAVIGDRVVCLRNTIVAGEKIYNGELFEVVSLFEHYDYNQYTLRSLDFEQKTVNVKISNTTWQTEQIHKGHKHLKPVPFAFGYSLSCHKCQGSSFDNVLFIDEDVSFFLEQKKFRYTAVTRAALDLSVAI